MRRILLKRTKRRKTEHGYYFDDEPEVICVNQKFPPPHSDGCGNCACNRYTLKLGSFSFEKHYSECEVEACPNQLKGKPTWKKRKNNSHEPRCCKR